MEDVRAVMVELAVGAAVLAAAAGIFRLAAAIAPAFGVGAFLLLTAWITGALALPLFVDSSDES
ncbi:MAG: hypothetical protein VW362_07750 [Candidatus Nanopelagicales bacterium]